MIEITSDKLGGVGAKDRIPGVDQEEAAAAEGRGAGRWRGPTKRRGRKETTRRVGEEGAASGTGTGGGSGAGMRRRVDEANGSARRREMLLEASARRRVRGGRQRCGRGGGRVRVT